MPAMVKKKERTLSACVRTYAQEDDDDYRFLGALFKKDFQKKTLKDSLQQKKNNYITSIISSFH